MGEGVSSCFGWQGDSVNGGGAGENEPAGGDFRNWIGVFAGIAFQRMRPVASIEKLWISPAHNYFGHFGKPPGEHATVSVEAVECHAGKGLVGLREVGWTALRVRVAD